MSLYDVLGAVGTGLRVAGGGLSPQAFGVQAQQDENEKIRQEQKKQFLAQLLTQHYQQRTLDPQAYQQAMGKLGINLPPIQDQPDYSDVTARVNEKLDSGGYLNDGVNPGISPPGGLRTDANGVSVKPVPAQPSDQPTPIAENEIKTPDVPVIAPKTVVYTDPEINAATADFSKSLPRNMPLKDKRKAISDYRNNLDKKRREQLQEANIRSEIAKREWDMSDAKKTALQRDIAFIDSLPPDDPRKPQLEARILSGKKTAEQKNIESYLSARGLKMGTKEWNDEYAKEHEKLQKHKKESEESANPLGDDPEFWYEYYYMTKTLPPMAWGQAGKPSREAFINGFPEWMRKHGLTAGDAAANQAENKANGQALNALTKDLNTFEPYKRMLDTNADVAIQLGKKIYQFDSKLANKPLNWIRENAASVPNVSEYMFQMRLVQTEAARVVNNPRIVGQLTDEARKEMDAVITGNASIEVVERVLKRLKADGTNRFNAMRDQQKEIVNSLRGKKTTKESKKKYSSWKEASDAYIRGEIERDELDEYVNMP